VPGDQSELEAGAAGRLIAFSDGVVAIAITLLAFELPVPSGATTHAFWSSVRHDDSHYLAFFLSFVVIAAAWSQHHHVMRFAQRSDPRLRTLNMLWLLTIILNPFATKLLTSEGRDALGAHALRFGFYALLQVLASGTFLAILRHLDSHGLLAADTPSRVVPEESFRTYGVILGFGGSIPVFFATRDAWVLWIVGPVLLGQITRRRRARATGRAGRPVL
jgi:uncharacterized membrane protein